MNDPLLTPQRYTRIRELFLQVCELDPLERSAILDSACADDGDLRGEVESLLREDSHASGIVGEHQQRRNTVSALARSASMTPLESLPCQFGRYRLLRVIGEGGMGTVYEAQQLHPHRMVALKVLRPGLVTTAMLRRFDYEAHVLGLLQHPGIAQIFEAGTADHGQREQPFFAMELVRGQPLLKYAAAHTLSVRQKLELMARVCDAVQHAHTKGVVHRDLKPNNILIDESGQPRILDFGVARATDCDIQTTTLHTQVGQLVGTLAYMSPEQAGGNPDEVDTRSDVYSLGVICYELLSGRLPLELERKPLHEAVRLIREQDPPKLGAFDRAFRGDIETIVAKAMEKEPARRYQSATELGTDLHQFLAYLPIVARPSSLWYHVRVLARRHRVPVIAASFAVAALVLGTIGLTYGYVFAMRARLLADEAKADAQRQAAAAMTALQLVENERTRAESESRRAQAVFDFLTDVVAAADPENSRGEDVLVKDILRAASRKLSATEATDVLTEAGVRTLIGAILYRTGANAEAREHLESALAVQTKQLGPGHRETVKTLNFLAHTLNALGETDRAEQLYRQVLQLVPIAFGNDDSRLARTQSALGTLLQTRGRLEEARELLQQAVATLERQLGREHPHTSSAIVDLAAFHSRHGDLATAEAMYREVYDLRVRTVGPDHPQTIVMMANLGLLYRRMGRWVDAEQMQVQALQGTRKIYGEHDSRTLICMSNLGALYSAMNRLAEAEPLLLQSLDLCRAMQGENHRECLTKANSLAMVYYRMGRLAESEQLHRRTLERRREVLGEDHPETLVSMQNLAMVLETLERLDEAEHFAGQSLEGRIRVLGPAHPETLGSRGSMAQLLLHRNDLNAAEQAYRELLVLAEESIPPRHSSSAMFKLGYGRTLLRQGRFDEAEPILLDALAIIQEQQPPIDRDVANGARALIELYERSDRPERAATYYEILNRSEPKVPG